MKDTDLHSRIPGLAEPWFVEAVELNTGEGREDIRVEHGAGMPWACPIGLSGSRRAARLASSGHAPVQDVSACADSASGLPRAWRHPGQRALGMKESPNDVWKYLSTGWARRLVKRWLALVNKSGLTPMRKAGGLIQRHQENILTFCRHRITNGVAEGLNSKIMAIKRKACGDRNLSSRQKLPKIYGQLTVTLGDAILFTTTLGWPHPSPGA